MHLLLNGWGREKKVGGHRIAVKPVSIVNSEFKPDGELGDCLTWIYSDETLQAYGKVYEIALNGDFLVTIQFSKEESEKLASELMTKLAYNSLRPLVWNFLNDFSSTIEMSFILPFIKGKFKSDTKNNCALLRDILKDAIDSNPESVCESLAMLQSEILGKIKKDTPRKIPRLLAKMQRNLFRSLLRNEKS